MRAATRRVIGLAGFAGAGKDEAAKALVKQGFYRMSFADPIRDLLYATNPEVSFASLDGQEPISELPAGMDPDDLNWGQVMTIREVVDKYGWDKAKRFLDMEGKECPVRGLLQRLGAEGGRGVLGETIWIETAYRHVANIKHDIVITDVRFPNEKRFIEDWQGKLIWVNRPGVNSLNAHASENMITHDMCDFVINNVTGIEGLHRQIEQAAVNLFPSPVST